MKKKAVVAGILLSTLVLLSFTRPAERYFEIAKNLDIFASLFKEVNTYYVDDVNPNKLVRTGIDAMLNSLDPYTNFYPEDEIEDFNTMTTGQYGGIGAGLREIGHRIVITVVHEGYPAQKNGLKVGDEVIKMNGIELSKMSSEEVGHLFNGQVGTTMRLSIKRMGVDNPIDLEFKREKITISNVPYSGMVAADVGYIQLSDFTNEAGLEVKNAIVKLKEKGAKRIILDLRGNPGGLLLEAVNVCNIFLPKGKLIVTTKGRSEENNAKSETVYTPIDTEIPLAVLIDRGSASASEIVAGTIQDYDRGIIIGEKSFGKGLVQARLNLSYNSKVKITTAKYYTPAGRCVQVLDYSHRRPDGSVGPVPDSLKRQFLTTHGRKVYDGGGIEPDIPLENPEAPLIAQVLNLNGLLFDYSTLYNFKHATLAPPKEFTLTDDEYQDFVTWAKSKDFNYRSKMEVQLAAFTEEARKENYYEDMKSPLESMHTKLVEIRKGDMMKYKTIIKELLEQEIITNRYYEKGAVEFGFRFDDDVKKAIDVLHDDAGYKKILNLP